MRNYYTTINSLAEVTSAATKGIQICPSLSPNESHQIKESSGSYFRRLDQKDLEEGKHSGEILKTLHTILREEGKDPQIQVLGKVTGTMSWEQCPVLQLDHTTSSSLQTLVWPCSP